MDIKPNLAFIDGQNLHLGTTQDGWKVNYKRFRKYLYDKYKVEEANYFLGFISEDEQDLYANLQKSGFIVCFREHYSALRGTKKGNVDTDIVFEAMKALTERNDFGKIILVSGDGDYKKLVDYLIQKGRLEKILFPNRQFASSLYKHIGRRYFDNLDRENVRRKIEHK